MRCHAGRNSRALPASLLLDDFEQHGRLGGPVLLVPQAQSENELPRTEGVRVQFFLFKIAVSLSTRERIALGAVVVLALLYFVPGMIHAGISAHRKALEIRASQGR